MKNRPLTEPGSSLVSRMPYASNYSPTNKLKMRCPPNRKKHSMWQLNKMLDFTPKVAMTHMDLMRQVQFHS